MRAHALCGSSGNLGAKRMMSLCRELESAAEASVKNGDPTPLDALVGRLEGEFARVKTELSAVR